MTDVNKHTPGPWTLEDGEALVIRGSDDGQICIANWLRGRGGLGGRRKNDEVQANARLIAAAPDLLDALKGVVRIADRQTVEFDAARAAIAKAEGR
jgi:hypothetical protein